MDWSGRYSLFSFLWGGVEWREPAPAEARVGDDGWMRDGLERKGWQMLIDVCLRLKRGDTEYK
jgi:hypothetical protein